ncbi:MAG: hypothetical protein B7Y56_15625 [Gallionellales bacterium 35-53-114]|jgi:hypothetical protein|nr:MAG: hypothetical protein B7Y56_15625 [Gallionellales bacterium 35-53-114]OYZ62199.1 MAG: hypothetical protein B7Y04_15230 [Gallionellales bacterium 24-53-125]OZB07258.1 MAG: hypothetical protein B7X61_15470 [Gallionellales bacterium 39-52-133]HQS59784.1 hypothetical protein [Gallionellaceae bacterium]HQS76538.1 hypothetical protein [Gallionellaceae bacterium]
MPDTYTQCPKCNFKPLKSLPVSEPCPSCGIYVFKWGKAPRPLSPINTSDEFFADGTGGIFASLLQPMEKIESITFYSRCLGLFLLVVWSFYLAAYDYRYGEIFGSFMHNILLPIHEAGHVLFMPFGEFMTIIGGSLFQLALPIGICVAFIRVNRDNFGAAIGLWWASISLLDLSPYVYDALQPQLILLGGYTGEDGPHDWIYLLTWFGQLHNAQRWGTFVYGLGFLLMLAALVWGALILWAQRNQLATSENRLKRQ